MPRRAAQAAAKIAICRTRGPIANVGKVVRACGTAVEVGDGAATLTAPVMLNAHGVRARATFQKRSLSTNLTIVPVNVGYVYMLYFISLIQLKDSVADALHERGFVQESIHAQ